MCDHTDRQLLELAAKAAVYVIVTERQRERDEAGEGDVGLWLEHDTCWHPLASDGAAFGLMADAKINLHHEREFVIADKDGWQFESTCFDSVSGGRRAACREAIFLCAIKAGEAMP